MTASLASIDQGTQNPVQTDLPAGVSHRAAASKKAACSQPTTQETHETNTQPINAAGTEQAVQTGEPADLDETAQSVDRHIAEPAAQPINATGTEQAVQTGEPADLDETAQPDLAEVDELAALRAEMEQYLREKDALIEALQQQAQKQAEAAHRQQLREALLTAGAHPQVAALVSALMGVAAFQGDTAAMADAAQQLKAQYGALFLQETRQGIPGVSPLRNGAAPLTRQGVAGLTEGEIIARWPQVQVALQQA